MRTTKPNIPILHSLDFCDLPEASRARVWTMREILTPLGKPIIPLSFGLYDVFVGWSELSDKERVAEFMGESPGSPMVYLIGTGEAAGQDWSVSWWALLAKVFRLPSEASIVCDPGISQWYVFCKTNDSSPHCELFQNELCTRVAKILSDQAEHMRSARVAI